MRSSKKQKRRCEICLENKAPKDRPWCKYCGRKIRVWVGESRRNALLWLDRKEGDNWELISEDLNLMETL